MHAGDVARTIVGGKTAYDRSRAGAEFGGVDRELAKANLLASVCRLMSNRG